jgi:nucleoside-diphosphate-sugar epimerase
MIAKNAYEEAVQDVSGIVHLASVVSFSSDPEVVIPPTMKGVLNVFSAARAEPTVRSLVYTSSSTAAYSPVANEKIIVTKDTWNEAVLEKVRTSSSPNAYGKLKSHFPKR